MPVFLADFLDLRRRSLTRASLLVLISFFAAAWLSDFPHNRATPLLLLPAFAAFAGTAVAGALVAAAGPVSGCVRGTGVTESVVSATPRGGEVLAQV